MAVEQVLIEYKAKIEQFEAQLNQAIAKLHQVESTAKSSADKTSQAFNKNARSVNELRDNLQNLIARRDAAFNPQSIQLFNRMIDKTETQIKSLTTATKEHGKAIKNNAGAMQELIGHVTELASMVGIAFSVEAAFEFGKASVEAFAEAEEASKKLLFALNGNIAAHDRLIKQAETLQNTTPFEDDAIVAAQAYLAAQGRTEAQIKRTIEAAVNLATVTGTDVQSATEQLNATFEGNVRGLARLDSRLKDFTQTEYENGAAVDLIAEKYKGFAEDALETTGGKLKQMKNFFNDFEESAGSVIATVFTTWKNYIESITEIINKNIYDFRSFQPMSGEEKRLSLLEAQIIRVKTNLKKTDEEFSKVSGGKSKADVQEALNKKIEEYIQLGGEEGKITIAGEQKKQQASKKTIENLEAEISRKQEQMKEEEIGSAKQKQFLKEITQMQEDLAHANGQQTEAEKKASQKRDEDNRKKEAQAEKEKQQLIELRKLQKDLRDQEIKDSLDERNKELFDLEQKAMTLQKAGFDQVEIDEYIRKEEDKVNAKYDQKEVDAHQKFLDELAERDQAMTDMQGERRQEDIDKDKEGLDKKLENFLKYSEAVGQLANSAFEFASAKRERESQEISEKEKEELAALDVKFGIKKEKETAYEKEKREIQEKFAKEQNEVKLKQAKLDKAQALFNIAINTAQAIVKSVADSPLTFGLPWSAVAAAIGIAQAAVVAAKPLPKFAKGVIGFRGDGTETSDSNLVRISKGESIITADATKKHKYALEEMNAGRWDQYISSVSFSNGIKKLQNAQREQLTKREKSELKQMIRAELDDTGIRHDIQRNKTVHLSPETISGLGQELSYRNKKRTP